MPATPALDLEAGRLERVGQPGGGPVLLVAELGMGVDAMRELDEARVGSLERGPALAVVVVGHDLPSLATRVARLGGSRRPGARWRPDGSKPVGVGAAAAA